MRILAGFGVGAGVGSGKEIGLEIGVGVGVNIGPEIGEDIGVDIGLEIGLVPDWDAKTSWLNSSDIKDKLINAEKSLFFIRQL